MKLKHLFSEIAISLIFSVCVCVWFMLRPYVRASHFVYENAQLINITTWKEIQIYQIGSQELYKSPLFLIQSHWNVRLLFGKKTFNGAVRIAFQLSEFRTRCDRWLYHFCEFWISPVDPKTVFTLSHAQNPYVLVFNWRKIQRAQRKPDEYI